MIVFAADDFALDDILSIWSSFRRPCFTILVCFTFSSDFTTKLMKRHGIAIFTKIPLYWDSYD